MHGLKRIFYDGSLSGVIELPEEESRRLKTVLRAETGDKIEILSYSSIAQGEISTVGKRSVLARIDSVRDAVKPDYSFTVYQCLAKREYMDWIVEKYAELGVTKIVPVISARSLGELKENTLERFNAIVRDAVLQSENEYMPQVSAAVNINKIQAKHGMNILFHERTGEKSFPEITSGDVGIVIGPEGGFTENETSTLKDCGFKAYTPINSVLKSETAAVLFAGMVRMKLQ